MQGRVRAIRCFAAAGLSLVAPSTIGACAAPPPQQTTPRIAPSVAMGHLGETQKLAAQLLEGVHRKYAGAVSLQAEWRHWGGDASKGRVWFEKPARMRFEFDAPRVALIVADGEQICFWDGDAKKTAIAAAAPTPLTHAFEFVDYDEGDAKDVWAIETWTSTPRVYSLFFGGKKAKLGAVILHVAELDSAVDEVHLHKGADLELTMLTTSPTKGTPFQTDIPCAPAGTPIAAAPPSGAYDWFPLP